MIDKLAQSVGQGDLVVLINNLGGVSNLEMSIVANEVFGSRLSDRISCLMTSLDMKGFSITVCPVNRRTAIFTDIGGTFFSLDVTPDGLRAELAHSQWFVVRSLTAASLTPWTRFQVTGIQVPR